MTFRHHAPQILQHRIECGIESRTLSVCHLIIVIITELMILDDEERFRFLHVPFSFSRKFQQTIVLHILTKETCDQSLTNHRIPKLRIQIFAGAELLQLIMLMCHDIIRGLSCHEVNDIIRVEILLDDLYGTENDQQGFLALDFLLRMETVVAAATVLLCIFLSKIMEQHLPAAYR